MITPSKETIGGIVAMSSMDYLNPLINRPDLFEETTTVRSSIVKTPPKTTQMMTTLMTIVLSAFIFVTIVAWFSLLQAYYDSIIVNSVIAPLVTARLYYSITVTIITIIMFGIFIYIYMKYV